MIVKSKVDYFEVKQGDLLEVVEVRKAGFGVDSTLDLYITTPIGSSELHNLFGYEIEEIQY